MSKDGEIAIVLFFPTTVLSVNMRGDNRFKRISVVCLQDDEREYFVIRRPLLVDRDSCILTLRGPHPWMSVPPVGQGRPIVDSDGITAKKENRLINWCTVHLRHGLIYNTMTMEGNHFIQYT